MISIICSIISVIWLKIRHPSVKTNGIHAVRIGTEIKLKRRGSLTIGKDVGTQKRVTFSAVGGKLSIGDRTIFNRNDIVVCHNRITIGKDCSFGPNVVIYDHDHRFDNVGFSKNEFRTSPVVIDECCWIGSNVIILRGTHIGSGSIIGAGCIIKGEIPPHSLVKPDVKNKISQMKQKEE